MQGHGESFARCAAGVVAFITPIILLALTLPFQTYAIDRLAQLDIGQEIGSQIQGIEVGRPKQEEHEPEAPEIELLPDEAELAPPPVLKDFFVERIELEGSTKIPFEEIKPLLEKYQNQNVNILELRAIARKITQFYRQKGYVTSLAVVPPQKIDSGIVKIRVVEGKLGETRLQGNRFFSEEWILKHFTLEPGDVIDYTRVSKDILSMNKNADRKVKAVMVRGKQPQTTDIVLDVADEWPVHFSHTFDNYGSRLSGRLRNVMNFRHSSLTGRDDSLSGSATVTEHGDSVSESVSYSYPMSPAGGRLNFAFSQSNLELGKDLRSAKVDAGSQTYGITHTQPIFDETNWSVDWSTAFDWKDIWSTVDGQDNSRDHLRVVTFGPNIIVKDKWGTSSVKNDFIFGIPSFLGGSVKADSRSSRAGTGGQFFVDKIAASRAQRLFWDMVMIAKLDAQFTKYLLVSSQQFRAGGYSSVRGYGEGDTLGDYGFSQSTEFRIPPYFIPKDFKLPFQKKSWYESIQFVLFADMGKTYFKKPSATQDSSKLIVGVGGGLRVAFPLASARIDWGIPLGDKPKDGAEKRMHFSLTTNLPTFEVAGKMLEDTAKGAKDFLESWVL